MSDERTARRIAWRIVLTGDLQLLTPAHLGNGDAEGLTDMPLARDALAGEPLLTGSSIAGALRNYLRARERGYRALEEPGLTSELFGGLKSDDDGAQSPLIVDDARATIGPVEVRDGVKINLQTRTAHDRAKYDLELLPAGTIFPLRFELLLPDNEMTSRRLREAFALALSGFEAAEIAIGARRTRGFGRCQVAQWRAATYDLTTTPGLLAWLAADHPEWVEDEAVIATGSVAAALGVSAPTSDQRKHFQIDADFALASPILIRSGDPLTDRGDQQPDASHLRSPRTSGPTPIVPGTSLAGALRARAARILRTLQPDRPDKAETLLNDLFGRDMHDPQRPGQPTASRLLVEEREIAGGQPLAQSRVAIDRFTGGAYETALFAEAPHFGGAVTLSIRIHDPDPRGADIGLLLLLLKDLWTGDLSLGGASSVGRGSLRGIEARLRASDSSEWTIRAGDGDRLSIVGNRDTLDRYIAALHTALEA
jgi:CRISPR/Cas system CMR subunit Cmr4 (Cas7 group RAMP superfamily)